MRERLNKITLLLSFMLTVGFMFAGQNASAQQAPDLELTTDFAANVWEATFAPDANNFLSYTSQIVSGSNGFIRTFGHQIGGRATFKAYIVVYIDDPKVGKGALFFEHTGYENETEGCCFGAGVIVGTNGSSKGGRAT